MAATIANAVACEARRRRFRSNEQMSVEAPSLERRAPKESFRSDNRGGSLPDAREHRDFHRIPHPSATDASTTDPTRRCAAVA